MGVSGLWAQCLHKHKAYGTWNETRADLNIPSGVLSSHKKTTATVSLVTRNLFYSTKRVLGLPSRTCDMS